MLMVAPPTAFRSTSSGGHGLTRSSSFHRLLTTGLSHDHLPPVCGRCWLLVLTFLLFLSGTPQQRQEKTVTNKGFRAERLAWISQDGCLLLSQEHGVFVQGAAAGVGRNRVVLCSLFIHPPIFPSCFHRCLLLSTALTSPLMTLAVEVSKFLQFKGIKSLARLQFSEENRFCSGKRCREAEQHLPSEEA